jgi:hypothetical protein
LWVLQLSACFVLVFVQLQWSWILHLHL